MRKRIPKKIKELLVATKEEMTALYPRRLKGIILYGSYARGDFARGSDIDLLLLLDKMDDPTVEMDRYATRIYDLSLKYDTVVSVVPLDYERYLSGKTPLILNARKEGLAV